MPLKKGHSAEVVSANVKKMLGEGYPKKQAIAIALSSKRKYSKMAHGGMALDYDDEANSAFDEEADRSIIEENELAKDPANLIGPEAHDMSFKLAKALQQAEEKAEGYADGGTVMQKGEDDTPKPHDEMKTEEAMPKKEMAVVHMGLTDAQKEAILNKKTKRKFK